MSWTSERARVASLSRTRGPDDPLLIDARRALRYERLAAHVERVVAEAPALTEVQRDCLASLLRP